MFMFRALALSVLFTLWPDAAPGQLPSVLHITVTLAAAGQAPVPIPRYALLISDDPATSAPRRVVTGPDGTADVRLRAGNYTVESDEPLAFAGKGYQWTQTVDVAAGRDAVLELTVRNADVVAAPAPSLSSALSEIDPSSLLTEWRDSVVAVWTPTSRASGFVVDAAGLIVTNQRGVGNATAVEVQFGPAVKVAARVLTADRARDVAVLWIDPASVATVRPVTLNCPDGLRRPFTDRQKVIAIGAPLGGEKEVSAGEMVRVAPRASLIFGFIATLLEWHHRRVVRRELGNLDARMLRDVGLDAGTVDYEMRQWFWQPTRNWRD